MLARLFRRLRGFRAAPAPPPVRSSIPPPPPPPSARKAPPPPPPPPAHSPDRALVPAAVTTSSGVAEAPGRGTAVRFLLDDGTVVDAPSDPALERIVGDLLPGHESSPDA